MQTLAQQRTLSSRGGDGLEGGEHCGETLAQRMIRERKSISSSGKSMARLDIGSQGRDSGFSNRQSGRRNSPCSERTAARAAAAVAGLDEVSDRFGLRDYRSCRSRKRVR